PLNRSVDFNSSSYGHFLGGVGSADGKMMTVAIPLYFFGLPIGLIPLTWMAHRRRIYPWSALLAWMRRRRVLTIRGMLAVAPMLLIVMLWLASNYELPPIQWGPRQSCNIRVDPM